MKPWQLVNHLERGRCTRHVTSCAYLWSHAFSGAAEHDLGNKGHLLDILQPLPPHERRCALPTPLHVRIPDSCLAMGSFIPESFRLWNSTELSQFRETLLNSPSSEQHGGVWWLKVSPPCRMHMSFMCKMTCVMPCDLRCLVHYVCRASCSLWRFKVPGIDGGKAVTRHAGEQQLLKLHRELKAGSHRDKIAQREIPSLLLYDGHYKFDLRIYWLVASLLPPVVLWHDGSMRSPLPAQAHVPC